MLFLELKQSTQDELLSLIKKHGWKLILKEYPYMVRARKGFEYSLVTMNIYWNKKGEVKKIATHMDHPKKGRRQLYRNVNNVGDIEKFLLNPRQHSKVGYIKKK